MHRSEYRNQVRDCPNCGRRVRLNREGRYRRHFATEHHGRVRLCATSGHSPAGGTYSDSSERLNDLTVRARSLLASRAATGFISRITPKSWPSAT